VCLRSDGHFTRARRVVLVSRRATPRRAIFIRGIKQRETQLSWRKIFPRRTLRASHSAILQDPLHRPNDVRRTLRILSVLNRRFVWKSSETQDSIHGHVGPRSLTGKQRVHENPFVISRPIRNISVRLFFLSCDPDWTRAAIIGGPNRLGIKVSLCAERNERCRVRHRIYYVGND